MVVSYYLVERRHLELDWAQRRDWVGNFCLVQMILKGLRLADDWERL